MVETYSYGDSIFYWVQEFYTVAVTNQRDIHAALLRDGIFMLIIIIQRNLRGSTARYAFVTSPSKCLWSGEKPLKPLIMWNDGRFCRHFWYMTAFFAATFGIWRHFLPSSFSAFCEWRHFLPSLFWIWWRFLTAFLKSAVAFCRQFAIYWRRTKFF